MKRQPATQTQALIRDLNQELITLEAALRRASLWQAEQPATNALKSTQPFCVDTLDFSQWLQFVFLPSMQLLLEQQQVLPKECGIAPMAEESLKHQASQIKPTELDHIIECLNVIDKLLSSSH